jgi:hypothetical protein
MKAIAGKLTYSNVMVTILAFVVLAGGTAFAASHLGKNSVGTKQLKRNAVTAAKIKKGAVTAAKVKTGSLTGAQINASTLGTVPSASRAGTVVPPEPWHVLGSPGEPALESGWKDDPSTNFAPVEFMKDRSGFVHLQGHANGGPVEGSLFHLPEGFRPAAGQSLLFEGPCSCPGTAYIRISGSGNGESSGMVFAEAPNLWLDGITFLAES